MVNKDLIAVLACPKCKKGVKISEDNKFILCDNCKLAYPIEEDIPIMLIDNAISYEKLGKN